LPEECHLRTAQPVATLLGAVTPFWYLTVVALTAAECYLSRHGNPVALHLLAAAAGIFVVSIAFTLLGPVPINTQIARIVLERPPQHWLALRKRWGRLPAIRVAIILVALILLTAGTVLRSR
jgi:anthrone oxygenase-like protein